MQRVLRTDELVLLTLSCLEDHPESLACLARTCRSLHQSAINVLWRDLHNISPLIKLFPSDAWETIEINFLHAWKGRQHYQAIRLTRSLVAPDDWMIFDKYACLVRSISPTAHHSHKFPYHMLQYGSHKISPDTYHMLSICRRTTLLPGLRSISWDPPQADSCTTAFLYLLLFLGVELREIQLDVSECTLGTSARQGLMAPLKSVLGALQTACPHLESVSISDEEMTSHGLGNLGVCSFLASYRSTRSIILQFIPVSIHDFAKLTSLPLLETLEIVLDSNFEFDAGQDEHATSAKSFASLKDLDFTVGSIQRYESIASFKFPALEALRLVFQTSAESTLSQPLLAIIASQCNPEILSALTIQDDRDDLEDVALVTSPTIAISPSHLRHILIFRALRHFAVFASPWVTEYDDPILLDIATSWPKLEYLDLNTEVWKAGWKTSSFATLRSIFAFARGCPELWRLALLLDARGCVQNDELVNHADSGRDSDDGEVCDLDLEMLVLAWSPIAEPEKVAAALSYVLLPDVEIRHGDVWVQRNVEEYRRRNEDQELQGFSSQWKTVESLLPIFYRVREAERERARRLVEQGKSGAI